jgi:predicted MFS family arabinose efflux permease
MNTRSAAAADPSDRAASLPAASLAAIILPFALPHFISYLYRTVNAIVYEDLARDLHLAANSLGLLTGVYFLTFALAQLPVGVALDRYGPRGVQVPLLLVAAAGALLFAQAQSLTGLLVARGLIGMGVAGSLMAAIKACSMGLPAARLPLATSVLLAVGGLGAMASTFPMHAALRVVDWRVAFTVLAAATLGAIGVLLLFAPKAGPRQTTRLSDMVSAVGRLYRLPRFWHLALYSLFAHATYMAVQGLWMGPWLRDVGGFEAAGASQVLFASTAAMVCGSLLFGMVTHRLAARGVQPLAICGGGIVLFMLVQGAMLVAPPSLAGLMAVAFSFFGTSTTMNYAIVAQSMPRDLTGRVTTSFNLLAFALAFVLQWGLGGVIGQWPSHAGHWPVEAYRFAFAANLALQVPGLLLWLALRPWRRA